MGLTGTEDESRCARPALHISHAWDFGGPENAKSQAVTGPCTGSAQLAPLSRFVLRSAAYPLLLALRTRPKPTPTGS